MFILCFLVFVSMHFSVSFIAGLRLRGSAFNVGWARACQEKNTKFITTLHSPARLYLMTEYQEDQSSSPTGEQHFFQEKEVSPLSLQQKCSLYSIYQLLVYTATSAIGKKIKTLLTELFWKKKTKLYSFFLQNNNSVYNKSLTDNPLWLSPSELWTNNSKQPSMHDEAWRYSTTHNLTKGKLRDNHSYHCFLFRTIAVSHLSLNTQIKGSIFSINTRRWFWKIIFRKPERQLTFLT